MKNFFNHWAVKFVGIPAAVAAVSAGATLFFTRKSRKVGNEVMTAAAAGEASAKSFVEKAFAKKAA